MKAGICDFPLASANQIPHESGHPSVLPPTGQVLYENEYFSVQTSEKVTISKDSIGDGELNLTVIAGGPCLEVSTVLTHMVFNSEGEFSFADLRDGKGKFSSTRAGVVSEGMKIVYQEVVKANGIDAVKYTITSKKDPDVLIYTYSWPNKNQIFQLTVGGTSKMHSVISNAGDKKITYLDMCPDYYNFLNTLRLR